MPQSPTAQPYTPSYGTYLGAELQRSPGLPSGRYRALELPSRMGDRLHYPDGRVEPFPEPQP